MSQSGSVYDNGDGTYSLRVVNPDGTTISGGGGATQYTEGDTDASLTGTVLLWEDTGDAPVPASETKPMPVRQAALTPANDKVSIGAATSGGWTPHRLVSAASTNATSLKASAGQVGYIYATNVNAAIRYLKLYNLATSPTVGTSTPVATIGIPGGGTAGAGGQLVIPAGIEFSVGIAYALTTEATDAGTTGVAASEVVINLGYK